VRYLLHSDLPGLCLQYQLAVVFIPVISDGRSAVVVNPQLAYDDVMNERFHLAPRVVVARIRQVHVRRT